MSNRVALDLKHFKHVKSDKHSTTLQHKDGHQLTIAHKSLGEKAQKQLAALAAASMQEIDKDQAEAEAHKMAEGGSVIKGKNTAANLKEALKRKQKGGKDMPFGSILQKILDTDEKPKDYGKIKESAESNEKPQVFAEGGDVPEALSEQSSQVPSYEDSMALANPPAQAPQIDPSLQAKREIYNKLVNQTPGDPNGPWQNKMFGPAGQAPEQFDAPAFEKASQIYDQQQIAQQKQAQIAANRAVADNQVRQAAGLDPIPVPTVEPSSATPPGQMAQAPQVPVNPSAAAPAPGQQQPPRGPSGMPSMSAGLEDTEAGIQKGFQTQMQGIQQEAAAKGQLGQERVKLLDENIRAQQQAQDTFKAQYQELENERQAHMADVKNGYINPDKYWTGDPKTGAGGHSKIASAIGIILAGFNPTNEPNAAINFLKYQMDQNIQAQAKNLDSDQNLLRANLEQFKNMRDATDMTRIMQKDMIINQLEIAANKAATPIAQAQALQAIGPLQRENAMAMQQFAMRRAMMNLAGGGPQNAASVDQMLGYMRVTNPEMAKEIEHRYVPGVGLASVAVPDGVRKEMIAKQQFGDAVKHMRDWAAKHSGTLSPSAIKEGQALAAHVQNMYREGINGGVFKEGEQGFIGKVIDSDPTKFFNSIRVLPKLDQAFRDNESALNGLKKGYGLPSSTSMQDTGSNEPIKGKDGKMYMRKMINGKAYMVPQQ